MVRPGRYGVRGALVLLGALPVLVAALVTGWLALLTHREALDSLEQADAAQRFEVITTTIAVFDGELAILDAWSRSGELQTGDTSDIIGLWMLAVHNGSETAWAELVDQRDALDPDVVATLESVRTQIQRFRSDYADRDPGPVAGTVDETRAELLDLITALSDELLQEVGSAAPALTELVSLQTNMNDESILLTEAMVAGVRSSAQREALLLARARSDLSLQRVERGLSGETRQRFVSLVESEARVAWDVLHLIAVDREPEVAERAPAGEVLAEIEAGVELVLSVDDFRFEVFESISAAARSDGEDALGRRNLIVGAGVVLLLAAIVSALVIGRRLARRIVLVSDVAERVSVGELDIEPLDLDGNDEVSRLAGAMDDMVVVLRGINGQIDALAAGRTDDPSLDEELPGSIGRSLRVAIRRLGRSTEELKRQATHDALTGLLDRQGLDQLIEDWDDHRSEPVGVMMLDLDGFKAINDEHGHPAGDLVLQAVATRLSAIARSTDVVARLGGDEFAVLLAPGVDQRVTEQVSNRLVELICQPITVDGVPLRVGASVGWVLAGPDMPTSVALRQADTAMYAAKRAGKGRSVQAQLV
ncbi:MAG: diguanylate cyclase [Actinomycetota bacterium]